jgi:putative membrane protein
MWILRWIVLIVVLFFLMGFLLQNSHDLVSVKVFGWTSPEWPLAYMLFLAGFVGYVLSFLVAIVNQVRLRMQIARLRRENRQAHEELDRLRNLAIEEDMTSPFERDDSRPMD